MVVGCADAAAIDVNATNVTARLLMTSPNRRSRWYFLRRVFKYRQPKSARDR
jgi:hypothetical protein